MSLSGKIKKLSLHLKLIFEKYWSESYSQEGEDMILKRIFEYQPNGFYVDVGSHHPKRFSNTYYFYRREWRGINIDAAPGSMDAFNRIRTRDINIEAAVSDIKEELIFYIFQEPALNTFDRKSAELYLSKGEILLKEVKIKTGTLSEILSGYLTANQKIDFLSVDVEGFDLQVLRSNDWEKYRPAYILVECMSKKSFEEIVSDEIYKYLISQGYSFFAKTVNTFFFKDTQNE